jgi:hypothetical protein
MSNTTLYLLWGILYSVCVALSFLPVTNGLVYGLLVLISLLFFVPPAILLYQAKQKNDRKRFRMVRNLSLISLVGTLALFILNVLSVAMTTAMGNVLYVLLILISAPMICGQIWVLSLFLWAILLWLCIFFLKKKE